MAVAVVVPCAIIASSTGSGIAIAIGGILAVIAISAVFYLVGRSEDRERERAAADRAAAAAAESHPEPQPQPESQPEAPQRAHPREKPAAAEPHPRLSRPSRMRKRR